ncbi:MAG: putative baseplate assembly protein [Pirellulaceae bacterium]
MIDQSTLNCRNDTRRQAVHRKPLNGIDYVEIVDDRQLELCVHLFHPVSTPLGVANVRIDGGRRVRNIQAVKVFQGDAACCLYVTVDRAGDFSNYILRLVEARDGRPTNNPLCGFDPRYARVEFSFKVDCPSNLDCKSDSVCLPPKGNEPEINYLAKDYASFRQLILDRLALLMPDWRERHVPDIGIALVEVLAYVGDYLSYYQDAVATEAYLGTARQRISLRRHARLVDYPMHEGCNARAWVTIQTDVDVVNSNLTLRDIYFTTGDADGQGEFFEPLVENLDAPLSIFAAHSAIHFYTWGDEECCLSKGATRATLEGPLPNLMIGDVLIFEEVIGPRTGKEADADPTRRWAVRLTNVIHGDDALYDPPVSIVEIEWSAADALPFSFCLSTRLAAPNCSLVQKISVARGNIVLVDHGQTIDRPEDLGQVGLNEITGQCRCEGSAIDVTLVPDRFEPNLKHAPLTFSERLSAGAPAVNLLVQDHRRAVPQIVELIGLAGEQGDLDMSGPRKRIVPADDQWLWHPQRDLFDSHSLDQDFVVEIDGDGRAHLRFGDGELGRMPQAGTRFSARYRVGNGPIGNVGADTITAIRVRNGTLSGPTLRPRNPLPAQGGTAPEPMAEVKLFAPRAFLKKLQRAITAADYAAIAGRNQKIQKAGASLRWTGSWYEAQVAVDPLGTELVEQDLLHEISSYLYRFRRMGHDLRVTAAKYVALDIELKICVLPHYLRGHVEAALLERLSNRTLPDGTLGFFHPDKLSFGDGVHLSKLVAAAQAVSGVESVQVTKLRRLGEGDNGELDSGILRLGPLEIAQLDNDPNFPEHGSLKLKIGGGR